MRKIGNFSGKELPQIEMNERCQMFWEIANMIVSRVVSCIRFNAISIDFIESILPKVMNHKHYFEFWSEISTQ